MLYEDVHGSTAYTTENYKQHQRPTRDWFHKAHHRMEQCAAIGKNRYFNNDDDDDDESS